MFSVTISKRFVSVVPRRWDLHFLKYSSSSSTDSTTNNNSFAISYLISNCGVPKEKAISTAKRFHFESSEKPDLVLALLRDNGFSTTQISKIIGKHPSLLLCSADKTLKPKFEFFKSQGITGSDLAKALCQDPSVLWASLENKIIPCFDSMRSIVHTDAKLLALLKRSTSVLREDPQKNLLPNVELLRAQGVPDENIAKLLVSQPFAFLKSTSRFGEIVEEVKKMKFHPKQYLFLLAIHGLTSMNRSSLEAKFDVYRKWGLSEDEVQLIFRKNPHCMMISEKNIMSTMSYLVEEMGYTPSLIAKRPSVLLLSLKKRIIPRCSVLCILKMKGLVGKISSLFVFLQYREEVFLKKYVIKFEKEVPELLSTYQGKGTI